MLWFGHRLVVLTNCPTSSLRKSHLVFTSDIHNLKMDGHFTSHAWPTKPWISDDSAWSNPLKKTESITTEKNTVSTAGPRLSRWLCPEKHPDNWNPDNQNGVLKILVLWEDVCISKKNHGNWGHGMFIKPGIVRIMIIEVPIIEDPCISCCRYYTTYSTFHCS